MDAIYSFGTYVRRRRKALDMTQRELAEAAGCALVTLKKIETDRRRPSAEMAARLADCLALPETERAAFLAAARGQRPVDTLATPVTTTLFAPRDAIPAVLSPIIGRDREIALAQALLAAADVRLVTLVGPGGIGKTRLALAVATTLQAASPRPYPAGIVFLDLTAATNPLQIIPAIAAAIGFNLDSGGRYDSRPPLEQLADFLRPRELLLILDNLEQLDGARRVIDDLLRATNRLKILATSREQLDLPSEHLIVLPGLSYAAADAADPSAFAAGQLFLARARRLRPDFTPGAADQPALAALCARVEGLPLALELAAAWIDTLTLPEIAAELSHDWSLPAGDGGLAEKHQSLQAVWDSTWARLAPAEQAAFAQLCVFRGGFTRGAAGAIAGITLGLLGRLSGRYLIALDRPTGRYRIHELLRQYGYANLVAMNAAVASHQRHFDYFLRFAEELAPRIHGPEQTDALDRLAAETDNLSAALEWGLGAPEQAEGVARMMAAVHWYWRIRSRVTEASNWLDRALALAGLSPAAEAQLRFGSGHFAWMRGDFDLARDLHTRALALWEAAGRGDSLEAAVTTQHLAMAYSQLGQPEVARGYFTAALGRFRDLKASWWQAFIMPQIAQNRQALGEGGVTEAAEAHLRLVEQVGDPWLRGLGRVNLGELVWHEGDRQQARRLIEEGLVAQQLTGHSHSAGAALMMLGEIAYESGEDTLAAAYFGEAVALYESMGHARYAAEARSRLR